mmetsp:Transcript_9213/g.22885  ORF Transcript_9213/g.22885 Transcript_9213/m.22885 type:complete len:107 (-) Transcript_9213:122-442(-)
MKKERKNKRRLPIHFGDTINLQKQRKIERQSSTYSLDASKKSLEKLQGRETIQSLVYLVPASFSSYCSSRNEHMDIKRRSEQGSTTRIEIFFITTSFMLHFPTYLK